MRVHLRLPSFSLLVSLGLPAWLPAQDLVVRTHDLRDLTARVPGAAGTFERPPLLLPVGPALPGGERGQAGTDAGPLDTLPTAVPRVTTAALAKWLEAVCDQESAEMSVSEDSELHLRAPAGVHARVKEVLGVLAAVQRQSYELTAFELEGDVGGRTAGVLTPDEVEALVAATPPLRVTSARLAADVPWLGESGRSLRYVHDYEVEVAEKASISDPKVDAFFVGTRLGACATPLPDGRVLVRAGLHTTGLHEPLRTRRLSGRGLGALHLPHVRVFEARCSAALASGGALLVTAGRGGTSWLLRVRAAAAPALQAGGAAAVPLGSAAVLPLERPARPDLVVRLGEDSWFSERDARHAPRATSAAERLLGMPLDLAAGHALDFGTHLVLVDEPALQARIEAAAKQAAAALRTTSVSYRIGRVANELALRHVRGEANAAALAEALSGGGVVATLERHHFAVASGHEQAFVRDEEVEIAAKATAVNPVVDRACSGFSLRGVVTGDGERTLDLSLLWGEVPPFEPTDLDNANLGAVDTPETAWTVAEVRLPCRPGEWQVAHLAPDPREANETLVLVVRID